MCRVRARYNVGSVIAPRPVLTRLFVPFSLVLAAIVIVSGGVIYLAGQRAVQFQQTRELDRLTNLVRQWLGPSVDVASPSVSPELSDQLRQAAIILATRITLIAPDGAVFFDTHADVSKMENHNNRPEVVAARGSASPGSNIRTSDTIHEPAVYVAEPLDPNHRDGVVIRLSYPRRYWQPLDTPIWLIVVGGVASALVAASVLARLVRGQWIEPVRQLAGAAERMAAGDWSTRITPDGAVEIREFSEQLNTVATNAQRQVDELTRQRVDLQSLMDTLPDPLLVLDAKHRLQHLNAPAAKLFTLDPATAIGQPIASIVRDDAVLQLVNEFPAAASPTSVSMPLKTLSREIDLERDTRTLHCQTTATRTTSGGCLLVLRDVSALSRRPCG